MFKALLITQDITENKESEMQGVISEDVTRSDNKLIPSIG